MVMVIIIILSCNPTLLYLDVELSIFPDILLGDSAAIVDVDQLQAVADAKDGQTQLKDGWVIARGIRVIHTVRTTRDYYSTGGWGGSKEKLGKVGTYTSNNKIKDEH